MYCYRSGLRQSVMEKGKLIVNFVYQLTTRVLEFVCFLNNHVRFFLGKIKGSKVLIVRYLVLLSRNSPREVATTLWRSAPTSWHPPRTNTLFLDRLTWLSTMWPRLMRDSTNAASGQPSGKFPSPQSVGILFNYILCFILWSLWKL